MKCKLRTYATRYMGSFESLNCSIWHIMCRSFYENDKDKGRPKLRYA